MRRVVTKRNAAILTKSLGARGADGQSADGFATRLVKYIPAETITALGVLQAAQYFDPYIYNVAIAAVLNFLYLGVIHRAGAWQIIVSYLAFGVWVLLLGGPDVSGFYAQAATLVDMDQADFQKAFLPGVALFVTLLGPIIDEVGDRFVVNR